MRTGNSPSYLIRNPHSYCFRIRVPKDIQTTISKKELRYSLGTGILSDAKNKARYVAAKVQLLFRDVKNGYLTDMDLTTDQIHVMLKGYLQKLIREYDKPAVPDWQTPDEGHHQYQTDQDAIKGSIEILDDMKDEYNAKIHSGDYKDVQPIADQLLSENGLTKFDIDSNLYNYLCSGVLRVKIKEFKHQQERLSGTFSDDLENVLENLPDQQPKIQPSEPEQESISLGELADSYEKDKSDWSPSASNKWRTIRKTFFRFHDPKAPVHTITPKVFLRYRELLRCLPKAFTSTKKYDGMTADDVKSLEIQNPIDPKTVNGHIIYLHGMFKLAVKREDLPTNPASDMQVPIKGDARKLRDMFTVSDLEAIFNSQILRDTKYPYQFWVTVLSLFTGARREELCNLYREDIKQEDGIWYIDITADKPDKRIKTYQVRTVPLYSFLLDLGFIEYVKSFQKGQRLWPELNNNNRDKKYGHYYGRWFNNNLLKPLNIKPTRAEKKAGAALKDHHSFRHTLINIGIRAGMDVQMVKGLVGHKEKGVTFGTYFKGFTVQQIYDEIVSKIDHGIDLSHLKDSKWVIRD